MNFGALAARGQAKTAPTPAPGAVPAPEVGPVHGAVLGFLDDMLGHIGAAPDLPPTAKMMLTAVRSSQGMMRDALTRMPEAQLRGVLAGLQTRIGAALDDEHQADELAAAVPASD